MLSLNLIWKLSRVFFLHKNLFLRRILLRFDNIDINKYANTAFVVNAAGSKVTFKELNDLKIIGTRTSLDGRSGIFLATSNNDARYLKTNFTIPAFLATSQEYFSNTVTNFAQTNITFDDTTP